MEKRLEEVVVLLETERFQSKPEELEKLKQEYATLTGFIYQPKQKLFSSYFIE